MRGRLVLGGSALQAEIAVLAGLGARLVGLVDRRLAGAGRQARRRADAIEPHPRRGTERRSPARPSAPRS